MTSIPAVPTQKPVTKAWLDLGLGITLSPGANSCRTRELLTPQALSLVAALHRSLNAERLQLLRSRDVRQARWDAGEVPTYLPADTEAVQGDWQVAEVPEDLRRRRVEITGPVSDAKMVIKMLSRNELGHRADGAMVDFEDSMKPEWNQVVEGVHNVIGAARRDLEYVKKGKGGAKDRRYALNPDDMAKLMVRVRGLHLDESNLLVDGEPVCGGLLELALCLLHGAAVQVERGETPAFYIPKCEHYLEARWWERLFVEAQQRVGLPVGTLRATFLIETLPAAFQIEEILFEIRRHAAGLNVGRWDKIFSDIKVLIAHPERITADRASIGMGRPWMMAYARRLIRICHRRGAYAIGGMSAFTPGREPELQRYRTSKVLADKRREAELGHDGCWVSHPFFIGPALEAFPKDEQLQVTLDEADHYPDLLPQATPPLTVDGLRTNARVGIAYLEGWRRGFGCVAWDGLMEDLATLEISRAQVYQWLRHKVRLESGEIVDEALVRRVFGEEADRIAVELTETLKDEPVAQRDGILASFAGAHDEALAVFLGDGLEKEFRPFLSCASELA